MRLLETTVGNNSDLSDTVANTLECHECHASLGHKLGCTLSGLSEYYQCCPRLRREKTHADDCHNHPSRSGINRRAALYKCCGLPRMLKFHAQACPNYTQSLTSVPLPLDEGARARKAKRKKVQAKKKLQQALAQACGCRRGDGYPKMMFTDVNLANREAKRLRDNKGKIFVKIYTCPYVNGGLHISTKNKKRR